MTQLLCLTLVTLWINAPAQKGKNADAKQTPRDKTTTTVTPSDYRLTPGDTLEIAIWGEPEMTREVVIGDNGMISYPLAGEIKVAGLTTKQAARLLEQKLVEHFLKPQVLLAVKQFHQKRVYVLGQVAKPGVYPLTGDMALLDALGLAGGAESEKAAPRIFILRQRTQQILVDLTRLLRQGDLSQNVALEADDVVVVPPRARAVVTVVGEVKSQGTHDLGENAHLLDALTQAGGATEKADLSRLSLIRGKETKPIDARALLSDADLSQNVALEPSDVIVVPPKQPLEVAVLGEVKSPGFVELKEKGKLLDALTLAGGPTANADLSQVALTRGKETTPVNLLSLYKGGDLSANLALQPGDVIVVSASKRILVVGEVGQVTSLSPGEGVTFLDALAAAGGASKDADLSKAVVLRQGEALPVDYEAVRRGELQKNLTLQPGDVVMIPSSKKFYVTGEVRQPGEFLLKPGMRMAEALLTSGFTTEKSDLARTHVLRIVNSKPVVLSVNAEKLLAGDASQNLGLLPGDMIYVPAKGERRLSLERALAYMVNAALLFGATRR